MVSKASILATLAALAVPVAASAQTVSAARPESVAAALTKLGHKAELGSDDTGDPFVMAQIGAWKTRVLFYDCTAAHADCRSLQFNAVFDHPTGMSAEEALRFARSYRYGAVSLDVRGDPTIRWDVVTGAGIDEPVFALAVAGFGEALANMGQLVFGR